MTRTVKQAAVRKQELTDIALKQFITKGYEKTSVRSILDEAGGEIGMFYHHFKSKTEIYEAALEKYNENYLTKVTAITNQDDLDFKARLSAILSIVSPSIEEYRTIRPADADQEVLAAIHRKTLQGMLPLFEKMLLEEMNQHKEKTLPIDNVHLLSQFVLYGISAVIHDTQVISMEEKILSIMELLDHLLNL